MTPENKEELVYWSPQVESWILTSHNDVCGVFRDRRLSIVEEIKRVEARHPEDPHHLRLPREAVHLFARARDE